MPIPTIPSYALPPEDTWPASRAQWTLDRSRSALLIHDMQSYFLAPYDRAAPPLAPVLRSIGALRDACERAGVPVLFSVQPGEQSRSERGLLWDLWGTGIVEFPDTAQVGLAAGPRSNEHVVEKRRYSAFFETRMENLLDELGRDQLIITGVYGHIGCLATAVDGFMRDVQPFLVGDAIADFSRADHETALRQVSRTCGRVIAARDVLEILGGEDESAQRVAAV
ncbi:MAG: isochorismatase family protein [Deltaproteobacteria bacterium]|jgi:bifunctional isochorismate lyase/aryl carrier protein